MSISWFFSHNSIKSIIKQKVLCDVALITLSLIPPYLRGVNLEIPDCEINGGWRRASYSIMPNAHILDIHSFSDIRSKRILPCHFVPHLQIVFMTIPWMLNMLRPTLSTQLVLHYKFILLLLLWTHQNTQLPLFCLIACLTLAMSHKKVTFEYIPNPKNSHVVAPSRSVVRAWWRRGEMDTMCNVKAFIIVYGEGESLPQVFTSRDEAVSILN